MKEAPCNQIPSSLTKTRSGSSTIPQIKTHERGDKVVVNGAKESLLSILRKYACQHGKHTLEKSTMKFLSANKVSASYDLVVWMFLFLKLNCQPTLYQSIMGQYLKKMTKKQNEDETHRSAKYIRTKKQTLKKFIESAEYLIADEMNFQSISDSVGALYSKGKSRDNAVGKITVYLNKVNYSMEGARCCFAHHQEQSSCFFGLKATTEKSCEQLQPEQTIIQQHLDQENAFCEDFLFSQCSQEEISPESPLSENSTREIAQLPEDSTNKSYRLLENQHSFDLFDQLILDESDCSPMAGYFNLFSE